MRIIGFSILLGGLAVASSVSAGATLSQTVSHPSATESIGVVRDARFSANNVEGIGCVVNMIGIVGCSAKNAAGINRVCTATSSGFATAAAAIGPNSHIRFTYNTNGDCTALYVNNTSLYLD